MRDGTIEWHFTSRQAHINLKKRYSVAQNPTRLTASDPHQSARSSDASENGCTRVTNQAKEARSPLVSAGQSYFEVMYATAA